ncbi:Adenylate cyclase 2 [Ensifer psoraleae]|uniref:AAA family ATPase n=1 Tax=Sinorhizobium psoraleae TaxID=520838 RepID=UPI001567F9E0|nr:AAA family ATPase [Sinorhizobium psoraleae]NRP73738.1 Adenylate cyclase 2 [Sinorhizobium psoraleae]
MSTSTRHPGDRLGALIAQGPAEPSDMPSQHRQLTVMFADLVGSTALLEEHGPEAFSDLLRIYHNLCTEATRTQDGTVANYLGDGVISYFGYPRGTEDDPLRAVQAAWTILQNLEQLNRKLAGARLAARIGIATGRVIIHQKPGDYYGENVVGACLNKAARLQTLASANTAVVCAATRKLAGKAFEFEDLGPQDLKGFEQPEVVFRLRPRRRKGLSRFEALRGERRTPLVGRDRELALLRKLMARAAGGSGGAAVLVGEPGIGKSRLIDVLRRDRVMESARFLSLQCSPAHQFSSLHPVKDYLDWVSGVNADDARDVRRDKLRRLFQSAWQTDEEQTAVLMDVVASSGPEQEANADIGILLKRRMAFQILSKKVFSTAVPGHPLLLVFEDVHWIDPTSAEFLENLVRNAADHACTVLTTTRPEGPFAGRLSALGEVVQLERLTDAQSVELAKATGLAAGMDEETLHVIVEKSDGVPLFVEEYASMLAENLGGREKAEGQKVRRDVPMTLGGLVQNKLDRLNPHAQKVARIGATVGRVFDLQLVRSLSALGRTTFDKALATLEAADIAHRGTASGSQPAAIFKHALVQDAVYGSLSTAERRRLHGLVADAMLADKGGRRITAEVLADHLLAAGRNRESAEWRLTAAMAAAGEGSAAEALAHITRGLAATEQLPAGDERDDVELRLRAIEGPTLMVTRGPGNPAFGAAQARALELLRRQNKPDNLVPVIYNTALHDWACGRLAEADRVNDQIFAILDAEPSDAAYLAAHTMRGLVAWHRGDNPAALEHLSATVARYDRALHREFYMRFLKEFGVFGRFYLGLTHTVMGKTAEGAKHAKAALELAKLVKRPHVYGFALLANFVTAMLRDDVPTASRYSEEGIEFAGRQGFPEMVAMSMICQGWAKAKRGAIDTGIHQMEEGSALWAMTGFENWQAYFASLLSDAYVAVGRLDEARALLDRHDERAARFGEAQFEPLLAKSRAVLLSAAGDPGGAAAAMQIARERAARNKAALWMG